MKCIICRRRLPKNEALDYCDVCYARLKYNQKIIEEYWIAKKEKTTTDNWEEYREKHGFIPEPVKGIAKLFRVKQNGSMKIE